MKKFLLLPILLVLSSTLLRAQWQITSNQNGSYHFTVIGIYLFAGTNNGVYLSTDGGNTWTSVNNGLGGIDSSRTDSTSKGFIRITALGSCGTNLFAGTDNPAAIYLSTNYGSSWTAVNNGLSTQANSVRSFAAIGTSMFASTEGDTQNGGVFLTTNNGTSWTAVNNGLQNQAQNVWSLATDGNNLYAGTYGAGIFLSTNNGSSWTAINQGITLPEYVYDIAVTSSGLFIGTQADGILYNGSGTWAAVNSGLTGINDGVNALAVSGNNWFAATGSAVYMSTNNGLNWSLKNNGLNETASDFAIIGANIFVGNDYGVFVSQICALSSDFLTKFSNNNGSCSGNGSALAIPSGGQSPYSYLWSNGQTSIEASGLAAGSYSLTVSDSKACQTTSSVLVTPITPPAAPSICMVTVDSLSQHNVITWANSTPTNVDSFIVYREITTNNYERIAALPGTALSEFTDTVETKYFPFTGNPNVGSYRYKLQIRDTCGNYSALSPYHNTIYVLKTNGTFSWNQYSIEGESSPIPDITSYLLYRDNNNTGNWNVVSGVASTQTTMTDPNYASYPNGNWRIEAAWGITCVSTDRVRSTFSGSYSNASSKVLTGIMNAFNPRPMMKIFPNPFSRQTILAFNLTSSSLVQMNLYNALGQQISTIENDNLQAGSYTYPITISEKGIYFLRSLIDGIPYTQKLIQIE
jgi:hypothetical protein